MNLRTTGALIIMLIGAVSATGQTKSEREAILDLCGCFEVEFKFKETFAYEEDYELTDVYNASALELVLPVEQEMNKIVLQHILIVDDTTIIKHWRQDWEYQPERMFTYEGNNTWKTFEVPRKTTKGQWSQEVYGTDDTPRYSAAATWFIQDGRTAWVSKADAPLPRREYTKRDDYQIMRRLNGHFITDEGWVHEQDNEKVVVTKSSEYILAEEKGRNTYTRIDDSKCKEAENWWSQNSAFWKEVRFVWDEWLEGPKEYRVVKKQGDRFLPKELKELSKREFNNTEEVRDEIRRTLADFVTEVNGASAMR